ncbi:hypothetical protein ACFW0P_06045 [Lysobacter soli]|uniref:hypothetical protein n=1 Tax=Lysobacter soli TaxID=453783 RepID=UPI0036C85040
MVSTLPALVHASLRVSVVSADVPEPVIDCSECWNCSVMLCSAARMSALGSGIAVGSSCAAAEPAAANNTTTAKRWIRGNATVRMGGLQAESVGLRRSFARSVRQADSAGCEEADGGADADANAGAGPVQMLMPSFVALARHSREGGNPWPFHAFLWRQETKKDTSQSCHRVPAIGAPRAQRAIRRVSAIHVRRACEKG